MGEGAGRIEGVGQAEGTWEDGGGASRGVALAVVPFLVGCSSLWTPQPPGCSTGLDRGPSSHRCVFRFFFSCILLLFCCHCLCYSLICMRGTTTTRSHRLEHAPCAQSSDALLGSSPRSKPERGGSFGQKQELVCSSPHAARCCPWLFPRGHQSLEGRDLVQLI